MNAPNEKDNSKETKSNSGNKPENDGTSKDRREKIEELFNEVFKEMSELVKEERQNPDSDSNKKNKRGKKSKKFVKRLIIIAFIAIFIIMPIVNSTREVSKFEPISYSDTLYKMEHENISKIILVKDTQKVYLYEKIVSEDGLETEKYYSTIIPDTQVFVEKMELYKSDTRELFNLEVVEEDPYSINTDLIVFFLRILLVYWIFKLIGAIFKAIKSTIKEFNTDSLAKAITGQTETIKPVNTSDYSFSDVAGIDNERWEVEEVVEMLKNPEKYRATGAKVPKGILLTGAPGTGKTLIAKAISGEAGVNFYTCAGSNFDNTFVGVGASKVRELFDEARKNAPAIIFIDEIDTVAKKRYTTNSYNEQTLNQLLNEMDGFVETDNIIFIAATNHLEALDPAITRPGRFDRIINIPLPDRKGRYEILLVHAKNKIFKNEDDKNNILLELAAKTSGMSGAILENIINEASIVAIRNNRSYIDREDIDEAFIKIVLGISKHDKETSLESAKLTAYHEAGHAILGRIKNPARKVLQVSIVPRGNAGGYTLFEDRDESFFLNKQDFYNEILVDLGGRAAEKFIYGEDYISVGASADLENANKKAHEMIFTYAMGSTSQMVRLYGESDYNKMLEKEMYSEMKQILDKAYEESFEIIKQYSQILESLAQSLLEKSTLNSSELEELFSQYGV